MGPYIKLDDISSQFNGSTLAIIGKDTPLYLEENRSIGAIAGTANAIDIVASYEVIS